MFVTHNENHLEELLTFAVFNIVLSLDRRGFRGDAFSTEAVFLSSFSSSCEPLASSPESSPLIKYGFFHSVRFRSRNVFPSYLDKEKMNVNHKFNILYNTHWNMTNQDKNVQRTT